MGVLTGSIAQGDLDGEREQDIQDGEEESAKPAEAADAALQQAQEMAALGDLMVVDIGMHEPQQDACLLARLYHALCVYELAFWAMVHRFAVVRLCKALLFALRALWTVLFLMRPGE